MITVTFQVDCQEVATMLMSFYETITAERKFVDGEHEEQSDFEKRMRSITINDLMLHKGLETRAANCLIAEGLTDAYSIGTMFVRDGGRTMLKIPNLGKKSIKVIENCLHEVGFFTNQMRG